MTNTPEDLLLTVKRIESFQGDTVIVSGSALF